MRLIICFLLFSVYLYTSLTLTPCLACLSLPSEIYYHKILLDMLWLFYCCLKSQIFGGVVLTQGLTKTLLAYGPFHTEYYICQVTLIQQGGMCVLDGQTVGVSSRYM